MPKYPDLAAQAYYYSGSDIYGQSFLCISLPAGGSTGAAATAAEVLRYDGPSIYSTANVASAKLSHLTSLASDQFLSGSVVRDIASAEDDGGGAAAVASFKVFGKSGSWGKDLYADLVEPTLKLPFKWETWRRSGACACARTSVHVCVRALLLVLVLVL